jgi:hypothetical protein
LADWHSNCNGKLHWRLRRRRWLAEEPRRRALRGARRLVELAEASLSFRILFLLAPSQHGSPSL